MNPPVLLRTALLGVTLALSGAASALTLADPKVYTVPGADTSVAAFLPGGQVVVNADNGVLVLDAALKTVRSWYSLRGDVLGLSASPDGKRVAALSRDRWVVWDVASGRELRSGTPALDARVAFDARGDLLLLERGTLVRVAVATGQRTPLLGGGDLGDVAVSPDGQRLVTLTDTEVSLLKLDGGTALTSGAVLATSEVDEDWSELAATFAPDGKAAVVRLGEQTLILREGQTGATEVEGGEDLSLSGSVVFLNPTQFVYAEYGEGQLYDVQTGEAVGEALEFDAYEPLLGGPDGAVLALGRSVGRLSTADLSAPPRPRVTLPSSNTWTGAFVGGVPHAGVGEFLNLKTGVALNAGNRDNLLAAEAHSESLWTLSGLTVNVYRAGKVTRVATLDEDAEYETLHTSPDGTLAAVSGYGGAALLDSRSGKVVGTVTAAKLKVEDIHDALPTLDGRSLLLIPHEGDLLRYELASGRKTVAFKLPAGAEAYEFQQSRGGTLAVAYGSENDDRIALIKPGAATAFKTLVFSQAVRALRFSPDGKQLAVLTGDNQNALQVYDTASGALLTRTGAFSLRTSLLAWAADGSQLLVGAGLLGQPGSATVYTVKK
ncbi:hypothetical protein GO986_16955 [Deinococcus sp. HMF7620]|uniref:Anaphase-promoting complex subunit 4 WD40 domain-containing protein n=1 Tax=Deinococcus arboris TaxID=2682977 RepID=A0A7C9HTC6_9DEIO|nr:hypothetical protein [Deinococcus arboris]MVN88433.1 hypothetical protein [Deinococcus arboris]